MKDVLVPHVLHLVGIEYGNWLDSVREKKLRSSQKVVGCGGGQNFFCLLMSQDKSS